MLYCVIYSKIQRKFVGCYSEDAHAPKAAVAKIFYTSDLSEAKIFSHADYFHSDNVAISFMADHYHESNVADWKLLNVVVDADNLI